MDLVLFALESVPKTKRIIKIFKNGICVQLLSSYNW